MRTLSAVIAVAVLVCGGVGTASAQRGGRMGQMRGREAGRGQSQQMRGQAGPQRAQQQLFRGITLTDAQKTQLQKVRVDGRARTQALDTVARTNRAAMRTARQNGDTVALNKARQQARGDANRRIALRGTLSKQVRGVLTADQQKQFDANQSRVRQRAGNAMRGRRGAMQGRRGAMQGRRGAMQGRRGAMRGRGGMMQRGGRMPPGPRGRGSMPMRRGGGGQ